jgi:hypothetical protein
VGQDSDPVGLDDRIGILSHRPRPFVDARYPEG